MDRRIPLDRPQDIPAAYRDSPIGDLVRYHNLGDPGPAYSRAELLIGMCMDHRKHLRIPENFAYILRTGGGNLRASEFKVSYAIAIGGVRAIALLAHRECGMVNLAARRPQFVAGLVEGAGWERETAEEHFDRFAPLFEIGNEIDFVLAEAKRLRLRYPRITVAPLFYEIEEGRLYGLIESRAAGA
jgi:carbonic anhydrase